MNGKIGFRILAAVVLVAAIAGIAFFAFQAGVAKGSPITIQAPAGESVQQPAPYYYGYGMPYGFGHHMPFFGFGCFGLLIPLFLFFLALKAFRFMFWGPHFGHHMGEHHGPWSRHWENGVPPKFDDWHKRAHGEAPEEKKEKE